MIWSILKKHWELAATKIKSLLFCGFIIHFSKIWIGMARGPALEGDVFFLEGALRGLALGWLRQQYRIHAASEPLKRTHLLQGPAT